MRRILPLFFAAAACQAWSGVVSSAAPARAGSADTGRVLFPGPAMDYQPGPLRARDGRLLLFVERLDPATLSGDLLLSVSGDGGATWSDPLPAVATAASERHPAPVQHPDGTFSLFHMAGTREAGYRIHRATSPDGRAWTPRGPLALGWDEPGEVNPSVLVEPDGSLTMAYHRLRGAAYVARSTDGGATWDRRRTPVSGGSAAALPRIARRASDGLYLLAYQVPREGARLDLRVKTSRDPYDWSAAPLAFATGANAHDARPAVLPDGTFLVPYVDARDGATFDLFLRTSRDGRAWSRPVRLTDTPGRMEVEPYALPDPATGRLLLFWGAQPDSAAPRDFDLRLRRLP